MKKRTLIWISILIGVAIYLLLPTFIREVNYVSATELVRNLEKARKGDADAMWYLTKRYYLHFETDSMNYWARKAYEAGNKEVVKFFHYELGINGQCWTSEDLHGLFKDKDYFYRTYDMGAYDGTPIDIPYLKRWAKMGLPKAIEEHTAYNYSICNDPPLSKETWEILVNGARQGVAELQYYVRQIYEEDGYPETRDWLYLTANNKKSCVDRSTSQRMLAKKYMYGDSLLNIKPNVPLAMYWMDRIVKTSDCEIDIDCARYNYEQCVKKGYIPAKEDTTPYNKNPEGKFIWNEKRKAREPVTSINNYLDTIYKAVEEQDLSEIDTIPISDNFAEEMDYYMRHEL